MSSNATAPVSNEEQEQILQTIEMFEVITQANPNDCQSLEVLKEAYWKLGRQSDAILTTRRLADSYMGQGQYASAMLEYEGILQKEPENAEVAALLREVEVKLNQTGFAESARGDGNAIAVEFPTVSERDPSLIRTGATIRPDGEVTQEFTIDLADDGNEPLCKFLIQHRLVDADSVYNNLERVRKQNENDAASGNALTHSLIQELCRNNAADLDALLCGILDRTKLAYAPLEYYDVDRQIVKMLPESLTLGRLVVPFDLISRTVMIAMANPFDALGKEAVQQLFDYNIQWHVAAPEAIEKVLSEVYRLDPRKK